jgi:hypothetical protein
MSGRGGISRADWIVAAGAAVLAASLFLLDWYGGSLPGLAKTAIPGSALSSTGWEAFTTSRWVWAATIALALAAVMAAAAGFRRRGQVQVSAVVLLAGVVSSLLILYRIVHHPGANLSGGTTHTTYEIKLGIWLGLAAALAIAVGGYLQLRAENGAPVLEVRLRAIVAAAWAKTADLAATIGAMPAKLGELRARKVGELRARRSSGEDEPSRVEREKDVEEEPAQPAFTGLTVRAPQSRPGERRPGQAP